MCGLPPLNLGARQAAVVETRGPGNRVTDAVHWVFDRPLKQTAISRRVAGFDGAVNISYVQGFKLLDTEQL